MVAIVSVGAPRALAAAARAAAATSIRFTLGHGDLLVMGGSLPAHLGARRAQDGAAGRAPDQRPVPSARRALATVRRRRSVESGPTPAGHHASSAAQGPAHRCGCRGPRRVAGCALPAAGEPDVGDAAPLGVPDLLAVLVGRRRHLGGDAPGAKGGRRHRQLARCSSSGTATSTQVGVGRLSRDQPAREQRRRACGSPRTRSRRRGRCVRRRWPARRSVRPSRSTRSTRSPPSGSRRPCRCSSPGRARSAGRRPPGPGRRRPQPRPRRPRRARPARVQQLAAHPEGPDLVDERQVGGGDRGQPQAGCRAAAPQALRSDQEFAYRRPDRSCPACPRPASRPRCPSTPSPS